MENEAGFVKPDNVIAAIFCFIKNFQLETAEITGLIQLINLVPENQG